MSPAKTAEPIEMPFGLWTRVGPRKHALDGMHTGGTWRIRLNRPYAAAMRPFSQTTLRLSNQTKVECGPMPNVKAAMRNIGAKVPSFHSLYDAAKFG